MIGIVPFIFAGSSGSAVLLLLGQYLRALASARACCQSPHSP